MKSPRSFFTRGAQGWAAVLVCFLVAVMGCVAQAQVNATGTYIGSNSFASSLTITEPYSISAITDLTGFTGQIGEPDHGSGATPKRSAWWRWTAPSDGWCTVDTLGNLRSTTPVLDTRLAVYTGSTVTALTRVGIGLSVGMTHPATPYLSRLTFFAEKDVQYHIVVDVTSTGSYSASSKDVVLTLRHNVVQAGTRDGLLVMYVINAEGTAVERIILGHVTVTNTATGRLTGKLVSSVRTWSFTGSYGTDGYFTTNLEMPASAGLPVPSQLRLRLDNVGAGEIVAEMPSAAQPPLGQNYFPRRRVYQNDAPVRGSYTSLIAPDPSVEMGRGYQVMKIKPNGGITAACVTPDGVPYTFASHLHPAKISGSDRLLFTAVNLLYQKKGALSLIASMDTAPGSFILGNGQHLRPAATGSSPFYPAGFQNPVNYVATLYTPPVGNARALGFLNATDGNGVLEISATFTEMPSGSVVLPLTYTAPRLIFAASANKPKLTLNAKTGLVTGSVVDGGGVSRKLKGVLNTSGLAPNISGFATGRTGTLVFAVSEP